MNPQSPTPSSARGRRARRTAASQSGGMPYTSERHTEAYLLARDAVRRIQRTSSLVGALLQRAAGSSNPGYGH
jgi:hypothetical protein